MKLNVNLTNRTKKPEFSEEARKAITLLYLEEALYKEQYEECAQIVQNARKLGAKDEEVRKVIGQFLKNKGKRPQREAVSPHRSKNSEGFTGLRRF
jgi:hypothetical protein